MIQLPNLQTSRVPVLGLSGRRRISPCLMKSLHPSWPYQAKLSQKHWDSWFPFFPSEMQIFIYLSIYFKLKLTLLMELEIVFQGWPLVSIYNLLVTACFCLLATTVLLCAAWRVWFVIGLSCYNALWCGRCTSQHWRFMQEIVLVKSHSQSPKHTVLRFSQTNKKALSNKANRYC